MLDVQELSFLDVRDKHQQMFPNGEFHDETARNVFTKLRFQQVS